MLIPELTAPWGDVIDIAFVSAMIYALIVWLRAARAHLAPIGIAILGGVYLLADQLGLTLTVSLFQAFFAVFLLVLVVVFQRELRQIFERVAVWGLRRRRAVGTPMLADVVVRSAFELAGTRWGALMVLPGRDPIDAHVSGGIELGGRASAPLLLSLFDPSSPGHDGAVIFEEDRVSRFAVHLPLSSNAEQLRGRGTRHAAALGLSEQTDSLCVVVSEETGRVSIAHEGTLAFGRDASEVAAALREFLGAEARPERPRWRAVLEGLHRNWREMGLAVILSAISWAIVVPGSEVSERSLPVRVTVTNLPPGYELESVEPPEVDVTVSGLRRDLFFVAPDDLQVVVDAFLVQLGRRTFELSPQSVLHPSALTVSEVNPSHLRLSITQGEGSGEPEAADPNADGGES